MFALGALLWSGMALGFIWVVDPYGVSPVKFVKRVNHFKPMRVDIDRLIKPYEVWRYQPRTVFLGTSRIHQSMDPAALDGTDYAPAYNAAIPSSMLDMTVAQLELYLQINKQLKHVFVELFLYSFIYPQSVAPRIGYAQLLEDAMTLHFSSTGLAAALQTVYFNLARKPAVSNVHAGGYWVYPPDHNPKHAFGAKAYAESIVAVHRNITDMVIQPTAMTALERLINTAQKNGVTLHMVLTPNYPWDDYRLLSLGYWPLVEDFYRKLSRYENVISFAQYNVLVEEPDRDGMQYWNDPLHFSLKMGRQMIKAMLGTPDPAVPPNFMRRLNRENVEALLTERRSGLEDWALRNRDFVEAFEHAKQASGKPPVQQPGAGS